MGKPRAVEKPIERSFSAAVDLPVTRLTQLHSGLSATGMYPVQQPRVN